MATARVCVSSVAELIGIIPSVLGFAPSQSVALVGMIPDTNGERPTHRTGPIALVSLAVAEASALESRDLWRSAVEPLQRAGAAGVFLLAYDEAANSAAIAAVLAGLSEVMYGAGLQLLEAVRVHDGRVYPLQGDDAEADEGVPVPTAVDLPELAPFVAAGVAPTASLDELVAAFRAGSAAADRINAVEMACREWEVRDHDRVCSSSLAALSMLLSEGAPPVGEFPPDVLGAAIVGLSDGVVRDALASWLVPGLAQAFEAGSDQALFRGVLVALLGETAPSAFEDVHRVRDRLRGLLTHAPASRSEHVGGVVGLFLWSMGDGVLARRVWEAAPSSGFARIGLAALNAGVGPGVLFGSAVG